jgi:hypothetical protein
VQQWRLLLPLLPSTVREWIEQKAREIMASHLPYPQLQAQLKRDIGQRFRSPHGAAAAEQSLEDKIFLMLKLVMQDLDSMDRKIERYASALRQQQRQPAKAAPPTTGKRPSQPCAPNSGAPSVDVETQKLQRLIQKRSQMFDMLQQITDRHNETARQAIQNMR